MEAAAFVEMDAIERRHWWFRGKRRLVRPLIRRMLAKREARRSSGELVVLEVGCGTGGNLEHFAPLHPEAHFVGLDFDAGAAGFARAKGDRAGFGVLRGDGLALPVADGALDGALALDIIEHFEDDQAVVAELARALAPGASLVLSVPAWPKLWSPHDDFLHHKRRYLPAELRALIEGAGLEIVETRGFNFLLWAPIHLVRRFKARASRSGAAGRIEAQVLVEPDEGGTDFFDLPRPLEACLAGLFVLEAALVRLLPIRAGVSIMMRATKPTGP